VEEGPRGLSEDLNSLFAAEKDQSSGVQAIKELFDLKAIKMKSQVNSQLSEAAYFAKLYTLSDLLGVSSMRAYCDEEVILRVSNDRQGRKEAVEISRQNQPQQDNRGILSRWFGK